MTLWELFRSVWWRNRGSTSWCRAAGRQSETTTRWCYPTSVRTLSLRCGKRSTVESDNQQTLRVTIKVLWEGSSNRTYLNFRHFISPSGLTRFGFHWCDFFRGDLIGFGVDFIHYIRHLVGIIVERQ